MSISFSDRLDPCEKGRFLLGSDGLVDRYRLKFAQILIARFAIPAPAGRSARLTAAESIAIGVITLRRVFFESRIDGLQKHRIRIHQDSPKIALRGSCAFEPLQFHYQSVGPLLMRKRVPSMSISIITMCASPYEIGKIAKSPRCAYRLLPRLAISVVGYPATQPCNLCWARAWSI